MSTLSLVLLVIAVILFVIASYLCVKCNRLNIDLKYLDNKYSIVHVELTELQQSLPCECEHPRGDDEPGCPSYNCVTYRKCACTHEQAHRLGCNDHDCGLTGARHW